MGFLKKTFITASHIPAFNIGLLFALMCLACIKSVGLAFMDMGAVQLYLTQTNGLSIGIDFILVSILMGYVGYKTRFLYRHQGYGGFFVATLLIIGMTILIGLIEYQVPAAYDLLFVSKYVYFALINAIFWTIVSRFIPLKTASLKYIFVLAAEAVGYAIGGLGVYFVSVGAYGLLYYAMALFMVVYTGIYLLTQMVPILKEKFLMPSGEAQDFTEQKLVRTLLLFSFFVMTAFCLMNYIFYVSIKDAFSGTGMLKQIALFWGLFGSVELVLVICFIRTRYFYLLSATMVILSAALILTAVGLTQNNPYHFVFYGFLCFSLTFYMYFNGYVSTLLKTLANRYGNKSINQKRMMLIEPVGFMLGGVLVAHTPQPIYQFYYLLVLGCVLLGLLLLATRFYGNVILKSLQLREWPGTELMLPSSKILNYIKESMQNASTDEFIYFLRILETARHPFYYKSVLKSLKHGAEAVRLYALKCILRMRDLERYQSTVLFVFKTDESASVRAMALSILIQIAHLKEDILLLEEYSFYLDDRLLKTGAMSGFLNIGNNYALLAMDGLQSLGKSHRKSDQLAALQVMEQAPSIGLIRLLMPLLKSPDVMIVRKAIHVAGLMKHPESLPIILNSLDDVDLQEDALSALKQFGVKAYPAIERNIHNSDVSEFRKKILVLFLITQTDNESRQILLRALKIGNQKLCKTIIRGMYDSHIFWIHRGKYKQLKASIRQDAFKIVWLNAFIDKYKQPPVPEVQDAFAFLTRAMGEEAARTRESIFYQLLLLKNMPIFQKSIHVLLDEDYEKYPVALAVLQDILSKDLYETIDMVARLPFVRKKEVVVPAVLEKEAVKDVSELILNPPFFVSSWIVASALYCLRKLNDKNGLPAVCKCLKSTDALILETAIKTLARLESNTQEAHRILLSVPTSRLVNLPLESLLKN